MRLLLVMLKEPLDGQVKTRLGATVGSDTATLYYKSLVEVLLKQLQGLNQCRIRFCYAPDDAEDAIRFWILPLMKASGNPDEPALYRAPVSYGRDDSTQELDFRPQGDGEFNVRLHRAFQQGFADGFTEIAAVGSDCPECGARWINAAFSRLSPSKNKVVLGPTAQKNHYLTIMNKLHESIFYKETSHISEVEIEYLPPLCPVVIESDWNRLRKTPLNAALKKVLGEQPDDMII
ncbi:MAG: TIGR04282 family arsenosugar biosynthesis glycosyltransferase [Akkermansiaceae bacterium]